MVTRVRVILLLMVSVLSVAVRAQNSNLTVQSLYGVNVDTILQHYFVGEGVTITNGKFNNQAGLVNSNQIGTFNRNGFTQFPLSTGIIMTTGEVTVAEGPNDSANTSSMEGIIKYTEPALAALATELLYDCAALDFDFQTNADTFSFRYVFASEEYCEYVNSDYNDIFAFFLTGPDPVTQVQTTKNVAIIPGSISFFHPQGIPVAINNVNHGAHDVGEPGPGSFPSYPQYFVHNSSYNGVEYDGYTVAFTAGSDILACQTYHMKLAIGNVGDSLYDSGVFLEEHSFESTPDPALSMSGFYCLHDDILFEYTAQNVDSVQIITASGDTLFQAPFVVHDVQAADSGYYYLRAKKMVGCDGNPWVMDSIFITVRVPCVSEICDGPHICAGEVASFSYPYDTIVGPWVDFVGGTVFTLSPPVTLAHDTSIVYRFSMFDEHGCHFDTNVAVHYYSLMHNYIDTTVCDSFVWYDSLYTSSGSYSRILNNPAGCESVLTLNLTVNHSVQRSDTLVLVENQLPYYYSPADTTFPVGSPTQFQFVYTLSTQQHCDSTITLTVIVNSNVLITVDTAVCADELPFTWHGYTFTDDDEFVDSLVSHSGSDSVVVYRLTVNPVYEKQIEASLCEGAGYFANGFHIPGNKTVGLTSLDSTLVLQTVGGCDSVVRLHLEFVDTTLHILSMTEDFCLEMMAELTVVTQFADYVWSTGEHTPNITVTMPGIYYITASQDGCRVTAHIQIPSCELKITLPNTITPSRSDGLNDLFCIPELQQRMINDFEISIFSRWGEQVYYSTDKNFHWNGEVNGKVAVGSTFNYIIRCTDANGKAHSFKGFLNVL